MNAPPHTRLRNVPGAASADQMELALQQMSARTTAMEPASQSQLMGGIRESLKEAEMGTATQRNLANQLAFSTVQNLKGMAGVNDGRELIRQAFGDMSVDQGLQSIGMIS